MNPHIFPRLRTFLKYAPLALALLAAAPASAQQRTFTGTLVVVYDGENGIGLEIANASKVAAFHCGHSDRCRALLGCKYLGRKISVNYKKKIDLVYENRANFKYDGAIRSITWPSAPVDPELKQALCAEYNYENTTEDAILHNRLGEWYEHGLHGLPRDMEKAQRYYEFAAEIGSTEAKRNLDSLCSRIKCIEPCDEVWCSP